MNDLFLLLVGLSTCGVASTFLIKYHFLRSQIQKILATQTSAIKDIYAIEAAIAKKMGHNHSWSELVELKGTVTCKQPLIAELSQHPCVYFHTTIEEHYEATECEIDEDGDATHTENSGVKTLADRVRQTNFYLEDQTGQILIDLTDAAIDPLIVVDEFRALNPSSTSSYRLLGFQKTEKLIRVGAEIYVLSEVNNLDGELQIGASHDQKASFIVSCQSEGNLLKSKKALSKNRLLWGAGLMLPGWALSVYALLSLFA